MSTSDIVKSQLAVALFEKHLGLLPHPDVVVRLVQFSHDSPGLRVYKRQVAEALTLLLEDNGLLIHNGLDDARAALEAAGYRVTKARVKRQPQTDSAPSS